MSWRDGDVAVVQQSHLLINALYLLVELDATAASGISFSKYYNYEKVSNREFLISVCATSHFIRLKKKIREISFSNPIFFTTRCSPDDKSKLNRAKPDVQQ